MRPLRQRAGWRIIGDPQFAPCTWSRISLPDARARTPLWVHGVDRVVEVPGGLK